MLTNRQAFKLFCGISRAASSGNLWRIPPCPPMAAAYPQAYALYLAWLASRCGAPRDRLAEKVPGTVARAALARREWLAEFGWPVKAVLP